jgi:hypothetical protein
MEYFAVGDEEGIEGYQAAASECHPMVGTSLQ